MAAFDIFNEVSSDTDKKDRPVFDVFKELDSPAPKPYEPSPYETLRPSTGAFGTRFRPTSLSTVVPVDPNKEPEIRPMSAGESLLTRLQQAPVVGKLFQPTKLPFESEQERGLEAPPRSATEAIANAARNVIGGTFKPEYIALLATPAAESQLAKISPELATAAKQAVSSFFAYQGAKGATEQAPQIVAPGKTFPQRLQAGLETGAALGMGALGVKGVIDAQGIRSDTGQPETSRVQPVEGQGDSRPNVEPTPPEQPQPVVQGEETQKAQVAPTVTETTAPAEVPRGTSETGLRPAIRLVGGDVVVGEAGQTHPDIISRDKLSATDIDQRGFVDPQGKFLDREQSDVILKSQGVPTTREPGRAHSTDLPESKESPPSSALPGASPAVSAVSAATEEGGAAPSTRPAKAEPNLSSSTEQVGEAPIVGMGGATYGEVPDTGRGADIYGVAARIRAERAKAGQTIPIEPGEGVDPLTAVIHGQEILAKDPAAADKAVEKFAHDKSISYEGMTATRAKGEEAFAKAQEIEQKEGTDSDAYRSAFNEGVKWDKASKEMQTVWHKAGQAQQGETDLDTGSFTGLQRAYKEATDKDFKPTQKKKAEKISKGVKDATEATNQKATEFHEELKKEVAIPKGPTMSEAERRAFDAANKTVRDWAAKQAELENKKRVIDQQTKVETDRIRAEAARKANEAVTDAARKAASESAKREVELRIKQAGRAKEILEVQRKASQKALDAANKRVRDMAAQAAAEARKRQADPSIAVWEHVRKYLDNEKGIVDFADLRNKVATDMGLPVNRVAKIITQKPRLKTISDQLLLRQKNEGRLRDDAKRWLYSQTVPSVFRVGLAVPRFLFGLKVWGHGFVALGTHAPAVAFQPKFWKVYGQNYGKMAHMVVDKAFHEMTMQDLVRRKNYALANRVGLVNDPSVFEDYIDPKFAKYFTGGGAGSRGYSVLKTLRQDMFDQMWENMPREAKIKEVAAGIADAVNKATGVTKKSAPKAFNVIAFAPRLLGSRVAWLTVDPARAALTFANWKNASLGERQFAVNQLKEKLWVFATYNALLAANQGLLSATGSDQKINFFNPMQSDWLKFKAAGMDISYGNAMLNLARFPFRIAQIRGSEGGKLKHVVYPDESMYTAAGEMARSQLSPFAGIAADQITGVDYARRPLPSSNRPVPARMAKEGVQPYSWPEYTAEALSPIPVQEAVKEVFKVGLGMTDEQVKQYAKAFVTIGFQGFTGGRLTEDYTLNKQEPIKGF